MSKRDRDLDEEIRSHLRIAAEDMGEERARREFGNVTRIKELTREMWGRASLDRLAQDLRYALRGMHRNPGFTLTAVMSLALGIGANTAIFSLIDALLLRWLPVRDPHELVQVMIYKNGVATDSLSYPVVRALAARKDIFSGLCGFSGAVFDVGSQSTIERVQGAWVSGDYYQTLGVQPVIGRLLSPNDDQPGAAPVTVITDEYWERKFNRDFAAIGKTILIENVPVTIVGVTPSGFGGANVGEIDDITVPLAANAQLFPEMTGRLTAGSEWLRVLARPQREISMRQAKARLAVAWPHIAPVAVTSRMPAARRNALLNSTLDLIPGATGWSTLRGRFRKPLFVLMALAGLVFLIACANTGNLLLARGQARQREIAVRLAIGAGRMRLIRQLLTESVLLSLLGAMLAIPLAWITSGLLVSMLATYRSGAPLLDLAPDWRVLLFTALVALGSGILFGTAPALRATSIKPSPVSKESGTGRTRLASALVAAQVAMSLVLLIGATLFVRTFANLHRIDPGFRHEGVLLIDADPRRAMSPSRMAFYRDALEQVQRLPGVVSASLSSNTPLSGGWWTDGVTINAQPPSGETAHIYSVSPRFFETLRTPVVAGRDFANQDDSASASVAIVNEAFARRYFPEGSPLGQTVSVDSAMKGMQIVGVVRDAISQSLRAAPTPGVYVPFFQNQTEFPTIEVYASGSLTQVASELRRELQPKVSGTVIQVRTLTAQLESAMVQERLMAGLASWFGALALILAAVGLYGLLAYSVARRVGEIGIRMALGAQRLEVVRLVLRDAMVLLAIGVAIGLPSAFIASRWIVSMLYGVTTTDGPTMLACVGMLVLIGIFAGSVPARRASHIDPMAALRSE